MRESKYTAQNWAVEMRSKAQSGVWQFNSEETKRQMSKTENA